MIFNKFFITFTIGLSIFTTTLQASQSCLLSYSQSQLSFKSSFSISTTLSSHRKMKTVFQQGRQFKSKKEIIVVLHGLGKSSSDLKYFMQEAEKKDDSVLAIDLHGFGETAVLNNNYKSETSIPYEYSRDDVFEILKQIPSDINIKLIGHSYGGGIALSILKKMAEENTSLNVTKVVLLSTFVKNLDKYYQDAALSGQNIQAAIDYLNPNFKLLGIPSAALDNFDRWSNFILFSSNAFAQQIRDSFYALNPFFEPTRNLMNSTPNYMANMTLAPFHILANSHMDAIKSWQQNPTEFAQLLVNNIEVINGVRDLNFLDYSQSLQLPKNVEYKFVHAQNDSVVPNITTQELENRVSSAGYKVDSLVLYNENHYYLYSKDISRIYDAIVN